MLTKFTIHFVAEKHNNSYEGDSSIVAETKSEAIQEFGGRTFVDGHDWQRSVMSITEDHRASPDEERSYYENKKSKQEECARLQAEAADAKRQEEEKAALEQEAFRRRYNVTTGKDISLSDVVKDSNGKWAYDGDIKAARAAAEAAAAKRRVEEETADATKKMVRVIMSALIGGGIGALIGTIGGIGGGVIIGIISGVVLGGAIDGFAGGFIGIIIGIIGGFIGGMIINAIIHNPDGVSRTIDEFIALYRLRGIIAFGIIGGILGIIRSNIRN
jgi:hypothetical protein